ncbi:hypothetical protein F0169_19990, partial [Pseudomonas sp. MAFF 212408]
GWVDPLGLNANCPGSGKKTPTCASRAAPDTPDVSRKGAFREAKRDASIPMSQQPDVLTDSDSGLKKQYSKVHMSDINDRSILNSSGRPISTRVYQYTKADGSMILIQDHSAGHKFGDKNRIGDQGAHFNLRPLEAPRTGNVPGTKDHYSFKDKK